MEVPQRLGGGGALLVNVYAQHVPPGAPFEPACSSLLYRLGADERFAFERVIESWP